MNAEKLKKILTDHKVWLESGKRRGKRADLSGADLNCADLTGADLSYTDLRGANLYRAYLSYTDLTGASLHNANLHSADLRNANLTGADLRYANLNRADLTGAHFELEFKSVKYFRNAIFSKAAIPWVILNPLWSHYADTVTFV